MHNPLLHYLWLLPLGLANTHPTPVPETQKLIEITVPDVRWGIGHYQTDRLMEKLQAEGSEVPDRKTDCFENYSLHPLSNNSLTVMFVSV